MEAILVVVFLGICLYGFWKLDGGDDGDYYS